MRNLDGSAPYPGTVAGDSELDDLIGRLRRDSQAPPLGQVGDSMLKAAAGFVSLGVPSRAPGSLTPEQQRKQAIGCWIALVFWGVPIGLGVLGGFLYDRARPSDRFSIYGLAAPSGCWR